MDNELLMLDGIDGLLEADPASEAFSNKTALLTDSELKTYNQPHASFVLDTASKVQSAGECAAWRGQAPLADEAPQLTYEGGVMQDPDAPFISITDPCDETESTCPVLINQQHSSYALTAAEGPNEPSTSHEDRWCGAHPLRRFSVLIGCKKLSFKVLHAPSRGDERPIETEEHKERCSVCARWFSRRQLREHELTHVKPNVCAYCGRGFIHRQSLTMHERMHTGEKPFQCPICTKCFARQTNYNIHMKLHASGRRYFCSLCGKWYRTEHDMLDHQQQCVAQMQGALVHTDRPLRYQCSYCEKMFHHRRDKNIHERTHTGERPYSCGYCGKGFTQSQALTIHIRTHTGERPYQCTLCAKPFRDSSALRKHEFIKHTTVPVPLGVGDLVLMSLPPNPLP